MFLNRLYKLLYTVVVTVRNHRYLPLSAWTKASISLSGLGLIFCLAFYAPSATALTSSSTVNFQARLETFNGSIAPDGFYNISFNLYGASSGGVSLWSESYYDANGVTAGLDNRVQVINGYLSVALGSQTAFPSTINWNQELYLTMNIGGTDQTISPTYDGEMNPRLKLTAVPYAFQAGQLNQLNQSTGFTSSLNLLQPTVGNQLFQIADQAAAGTYTVCIQNSTACGFAASSGGAGYIQNGTGLQTANFNIQSTSASSVGGIIRGASGQSSDLLQFQSSTGTIVSKFDNAGNLIVSSTGGSSFAGSVGIGTTPTSGGLTVLNRGVDATHTDITLDTTTADFRRRSLRYTTNGLLRFALDTDTAAESGSNAGSIFGLNEYADDGTFLRNGFAVNRNTGNFVFLPSINGTTPQLSVGNAGADAGTKVHIEGNLGNVLKLTADTASLGQVQNTITAQAIASGSSIDGFGVQFLLQTKDSSNVLNNAAAIGSVRSGADDTNSFFIKTQNAGTLAERVRVDNNGNLGVGLSSLTYKLEVAGDTNLTTGSAYRINGTQICASTGCTATASSAIQNGTSPQTADFNITGNGTIGGTLSIGAASSTTGQLKLANSASAFTGTLQVASLTQNTTYTIPLSSASSDTICLVTLANCSGTGSGVTTVGALDGGSANSNGATITGATVFLQSASASFAGLINTVAQSFAGTKTFTGGAVVSAGQAFAINGGTAPSVSSALQGSLYFDSTDATLKISENGAAYNDVASTITTAQTYYTAPASLTTCTYDGDAGQTCAPADTNSCLTKAAPCATIAGARNKFKNKTLAAAVTVQLADTTGGTCYQPVSTTFENPVVGTAPSQVLSLSIAGGDGAEERYPTGYVHVKGNSTNTNNVLVTGATTCAGTTAANPRGLVVTRTNFRISGLKLNYYSGTDVGAVTCYQSVCYIENTNATSNVTTNKGAMITGFNHSSIMMGGSFTVSGYGAAEASDVSTLAFRTPAGASTISYSRASGSGSFALFVNEFSHMYMESLTVTFSGAGTYAAFAAWTGSNINWNGDGNTSSTVNGASITFLNARQGSHIDEACGASGQTCTFTSMKVRAQADLNSSITYGGATVGTSANIVTAGSWIGDAFGTGTTKQDGQRSNGAQLQITANVAGSSSFTAPVFNGQRSRGTLTSPTAVQGGDSILQFSACPYNGATFSCDASINFEADGNLSTTSRPTRISFVTHSADNVLNPTERLRIDQYGNVGIGTSSPVALFQVSQQSTGSGTVTTNGTTTLTGSGTQFTNIFKVGDTLTVTGETVRTISAIASDTSLTVSVAFSTSGSGKAFSLTGGNRFSVFGNGNVGINTTSTNFKFDVQGGDINTSGNLYTGGVQRLDASGNGSFATLALSSNLNQSAGTFSSTTSATTFRSNNNSATAFQVQNTATTALFTVDASNSRIYIGNPAGETSSTLLVLSNQSTLSDPAGVEGAMYFNAVIKQFRCYRDSVWETCGNSPIDRGYSLQDEFLAGSTVCGSDGTIGSLGWSCSAIGTGSSTLTYNTFGLLSANRPGILTVTPPANVNSGSTIQLSQTSGGSLLLSAGTSFKSAVSVGNAASGTTTLRVGATTESSSTSRPTDAGLWWEADTNTNANWQYCYATGAAAVCAPSSVAVTANSFVRLSIRLTALGSGASSAVYTIDGSSATVSAVTISATNAVSPNVVCYAQNTAQQPCYIDYYQLYGVASSAR